MAKAGRPKLSDEEKARRKADRDAAKANAPAAADRAEARANGNKPAPQAEKAAQAAKPERNTDDIDREQASLLKQYMPLVVAARAAVAKYSGELRALYKKAKAEGGFEKADFDTAIATQTAEAEARARAKIARQLQVAKWMGSDLGTQYDMFNAPSALSSIDRAKQEGIADAENNKSGGAKPAYDPATPEYAAYMDGFHSVSERRVQEGIKPLHPEVKADQEAKAAKEAAIEQQKAKDADAFDGGDKTAAIPDNPLGAGDKANGGSDKPATYPPGAAGSAPTISAPTAQPQSGAPMTRAQFKAQQEAKRAEGGS